MEQGNEQRWSLQLQSQAGLLGVISVILFGYPTPFWVVNDYQIVQKRLSVVEKKAGWDVENLHSPIISGAVSEHIFVNWCPIALLFALKSRCASFLQGLLFTVDHCFTLPVWPAEVCLVDDIARTIFCDMILMPCEKPHVSNWCHFNRWWIMQCMNLQLSHQISTALTTSHRSRVARTIRSSHPATKALVKSGSRTHAGHFWGLLAKTPSFLKLLEIEKEIVREVALGG